MRRHLPTINWKPPQPYENGGSYEDSADGMFRLQCSDSIDGIAMPREYRLWQFKRGRWVRIGEGRSRTKLVKSARIRSAQLDEEEDDE